MMDYAALLLPSLQDSSSDCLFVADENALNFPFHQLQGNSQVLTNRIDIARKAASTEAAIHFSDFDFCPWPANSLELIAYPISKEKAVVHHIANQAVLALKPGGKLVLVGSKQQGIKTYGKSIGKLFGCTARAEKHSALYQVTLTRNEQCNEPLNDSHYSILREIFTLANQPVFSKPGLFGWDKIDEGSALLCAHLPTFFENLTNTPQQMLDLGCGYGYLSLHAATLTKAHITATDNCAAAITACTKNFALRNMSGAVIADDCGDKLSPGFDVVLCNPPFHQGFNADRALTEKFLANTRKLLKPGGKALFVVNSFVPLEKLASQWFSTVNTPVSNGSFKLVTLG